MALSQKVILLAALVLCQFYGLATSQPCLYNFTIGNGQPVIITQSAPVCLICFNTANTVWSVGGVVSNGIAGAPYILNVMFPVTTLSGVQVGCYSLPGTTNLVRSLVYVATPVVPQVVTYVNETETLNLDCSKVVTVSTAALAFPNPYSWLSPVGSTISSIITASLSSINRTDAGNYTCVTALDTTGNVNGVANVTGSTLVVVYYPPTVLSPQPTVYMAQGRSIQLNCTFDGLPAPAVTWTYPNGSVISSWPRFTIQITSTSSSLTITSLVGGGDNGTYDCTASNFRGMSSNTVQLFVQVPPDPPSNLMVTSVGNSSISLSWTNGSNGFSPFSNVVISYEVDRYPQDDTRSQTFPMGTSATLVGLYPYSNYTIRVRLTNDVGFTSNPTNITTTTLSLRPMAPTITSVVAVNSTQLTIMWISPSINSTTTAPVTSWTVLYSCYSPWNPSSCPSGNITSSSPSSPITGLKKGSSYTFVVFGVNSGGGGDVSLPATNQTLLDPPTLVVGLDAAVMTTSSVNLTWSPPSDNGGQNISYYIIQYGILNGSNLTNMMNTTTMATQTQILLSGLTENSWYLFSVAASNGYAVGMTSSQIKLLVGYPIKPANVMASGITDTYVNITWQLQSPAGFIDYFILSYRQESSQTWTIAVPQIFNGTLTNMLTGLSANTTYVVGVATKNGLVNPSNYTTVTFTTAAVPYVTGPKVIYVGVPFNITCNLEVGFPGQITWSRVDSFLPSSAASTGNNLTFTNPQLRDNGSYTCSYLSSSVASTPLTITILSFTPSVSGPGGSTFTSGAFFTLTCTIGTGYTTPVVWSKVGSTSLPSSAMANGSTLVFTNAQPADSGSYTCSFLGSSGPASLAFVVSINDDITPIIIIVVVVGGVALLLLLIAISVLVCYCCFCRNRSGHSTSKAAKNNKWSAPVGTTTKPKPSTVNEPSPSRPHLTSFHTPAKPTGTLMHQGAITDELPDSYSAATTFGTTMNKQSSQPQQFKEEPDQLQYAALSFGGGAPASGGGARAMPKTKQDDNMVTYSSVETKGNVQLLQNEERYITASPEAPVTSMV